MRRLLVICALLLLAAGCSGDDKDSVAAKGGSTTTTAGTATTVAGGPETTAGPAAGGVAAGTTAKGGAKAAATTTTTTTQPPPPAQPGTKFPAPGTYNYRVTGKSNGQPVNFESQLVVDPPNGADQRSTQKTDQATTEQVQRYQPDGIFLVSLKVTAGMISKEFRPDSTALVFPLPPSVGKTWSWSATSTDGQTRVNAEFKIVRTESIAVGGQQLEAWVIDAKTATSGDLRSSRDSTIWVSEPLRLVLRTDEKGSSGLGPTETSAKLQSTHPS